ncbi:hypothetical protein EI94DRAFT_1807601 [Lactarius quietus]|nr:hypothetical protein EI94DRAFT_1807601 [Lactarius quietus]
MPKFWKQVSARLDNTRTPEQCATPSPQRQRYADGTVGATLTLKFSLINLDSEGDINWDDLSNPGWNGWSAKKLQRRWAALKAKVKVNGTHRDVMLMSLGLAQVYINTLVMILALIVTTNIGRLQTIASLGKHARACRRKWSGQKSPERGPSTQEPEINPGCKHPRIGSSEEDDAEEPGPSGSNASEFTAPVVGSPSPSPPPTPVTIQSRHSGHLICIPRYLKDYVPHGYMSFAHVPPQLPTPSECDDRSATPEIFESPSLDLRPHPFQSRANKLNLLCDLPSLEVQPPILTGTIHKISRGMPEPFAPFPNLSVALYMATYFSGMDTKSEEHVTMVATTMQDPRFSTEEMRGFNTHVENVHLDKYLKDGTHPFQTEDGWQESVLHIHLPVEGMHFESEEDAPTLPIHVCKSNAAETFHFMPYTMHWHPDPLDPDKHERVYTDTYTADAMIQAQTEVNNLPRQEGNIREHIALGLMLASDSAQLTNFGSTSVWPVYLMFVNQSKLERVKPSHHAVHHLTYIPSLGGDFTSRYQEKTGQTPRAEVEVHSKRELMHAVWDLLLDEDFVEGSTNGLAIQCSDDIEHVFFLRITTYSTDYLEKVLLSTIKNLGLAPCPRCLIKKKDISNVGTRSDARKRGPRTDDNQRCKAIEEAHKTMFEKGSAITSKQVQKHLNAHSMVPTRNAFSDVLTSVGQNYHDIFVVDLLHEFEIGIWKLVLTHLIRMLYAIPGKGVGCIGILDTSMPTFSHDTICKLPKSVSELSKLAARDYEDIL